MNKIYRNLPFSTKRSEDFCQQFKLELQQATGAHNVTVRVLGESIIIHVRASPELILSRIFAPLIEHLPRWEVKKSGWHHIFINHRGLDSVKLNYDGPGSKGPTETY